MIGAQNTMDAESFMTVVILQTALIPFVDKIMPL